MTVTIPEPIWQLIVGLSITGLFFYLIMSVITYRSLKRNNEEFLIALFSSIFWLPIIIYVYVKGRPKCM